jgi:uncharacterized LabA/DUF88 family protein
MLKNTTEKESGIALFIDIENLIGHCSYLGLPIQVKPVCQTLKEIAPLRYRRSYGDLQKSLSAVGQRDKIADVRKELSSNMVTIEDIPYTSAKNSADMYLSTAALSSAYENVTFTHFAFLATDKDYIPLYSQLRRLGKTVIVISIDADKTSDLFVDVTDKLFFYEELVTSEKKAVAQEPEVEETGSPKFLLLTACEHLEAEGNPLKGAVINEKMKKLQPGFDFSKFGFAKFSELLADAEKDGLIKTKKSVRGDIGVTVLAPGKRPATRKEPLNKVPDISFLPPSDLEYFVSRAGKLPMRADAQNRSALFNTPRKLKERETPYREILKQSFKTPVLPAAQRRTILSAILDVFDEETYLKELSRLVTTYLQESHYAVGNETHLGSIVFKTLLTLYFGRAFSISMNEHDKHNPLLLSIKLHDLYNLEILLNKQLAYAIKHNLHGELDPAKLSEVLYDDASTEHCLLCDEIIRGMRRTPDRLRAFL